MGESGGVSPDENAELGMPSVVLRVFRVKPDVVKMVGFDAIEKAGQ